MEDYVTVGGAAADLTSYVKQEVCRTSPEARGSWPAGDRLPPCWRKRSCNATAISAALARHTQPRDDLSHVTRRTRGSSCSHALRAAGCFELASPWTIREHQLANAQAFVAQTAWQYVNVVCRRLVPRDGCVCLPCFTECHRSVLCPEEGFGGTPPASVPAAPRSGRFAYATTVALSSAYVAKHGEAEWRGKYIHGVLRLALSLRRVSAAFPLVVLAANMTSREGRRLLRPLRHDNLTIIDVPFILQPARFKRRRMHQGTFTKLAAWNLTRYDRVVHLDADLLIARNIDHLFSDEVGTPAAVAETEMNFLGLHFTMLPFNSGLLVLQPSAVMFDFMMRRLEPERRPPSYDGGDQGYLATLFAMEGAAGGNFFELPRRYNLFGCVQEDEVEHGYVFHMNGAFHGGFTHPTFLALKSELDDALVQRALLARRDGG